MSPRCRIDTKYLGSFLDRPAHRAALGEQVLGQGLWLRKGIVTQELYNGRNGRDRRLGVALFPVQDGPTDDSRLSCDFWLGEVRNKAPAPNMITQRAGLKIVCLWNQ